MLCGLPASGKSTYAQKLMSDKLPKLSMDEEVYKRYGRAGVDYPNNEYLERYEIIRAELEEKIVDLLKQKRSFILDYGYWRRAAREKHKKLIEAYGGEWKLLYFKASPELVAKRIEKRNKRTDANAFPVTKVMLCDFIARFEEPQGEGEVIIEQT
jgi:predicted kinase